MASQPVVVEIMGKRRTKVPFILTVDTKTAIDTLLETRDKVNTYCMKICLYLLKRETFYRV